MVIGRKDYIKTETADTERNLSGGEFGLKAGELVLTAEEKVSDPALVGGKVIRDPHGHTEKENYAKNEEPRPAYEIRFLSPPPGEQKQKEKDCTSNDSQNVEV